MTSLLFLNRKHKVIRLLLIFLLALAASACSSASPTPSPSATPPPPTETPIPPTETLTPTDTPIPPTSTPVPPTVTPTETDTATPTETSIPLVHISFLNDTGGMVCGVFFYPDDFDGEVPNLVDVEAGKIMMPGDILEIDLPPGSYNTSVWDCMGNRLQDFPFYDLQGEELTWELSQPLIVYTEALVTIVNQLAYDLCEFYVRPGDSTDWGENILAPDWGFYITAGSTYLHWVDVGGVYDFQLRFCNGAIAGELYNQEVPSNMEWTLRP